MLGPSYRTRLPGDSHVSGAMVLVIVAVSFSISWGARKSMIQPPTLVSTGFVGCGGELYGSSDGDD